MKIESVKKLSGYLPNEEKWTSDSNGTNETEQFEGLNNPVKRFPTGSDSEHFSVLNEAMLLADVFSPRGATKERISSRVIPEQTTFRRKCIIGITTFIVWQESAFRNFVIEDGHLCEICIFISLVHST
ncbi:hypothetical protein CDAR_401 [Caerostris darwini]|uniref:Uncharacterized protein n=1 Tax=Caerostris darwini TaxID=1538125 RepID=A0AAV4UC57_9ARAC|nr:hypothetical protein CDAR_401 [Caerostris darwini]